MLNINALADCDFLKFPFHSLHFSFDLILFVSYVIEFEFVFVAKVIAPYFIELLVHCQELFVENLLDSEICAKLLILVIPLQLFGLLLLDHLGDSFDRLFCCLSKSDEGLGDWWLVDWLLQYVFFGLPLCG